LTRKTACREKQTHLGIGFSEHILKKRHRIESGRYSWKHDRQDMKEDLSEIQTNLENCILNILRGKT
jgi:hypothetical protein